MNCLTMLTIALLVSGLVPGKDAFSAETNPCAEDIAKFCADLKPGGAAVIGCLEKHESGLSDACRAHEAKMHGKRAEKKELVKELIDFHQACRGDISRLCSDVKQESEQMINCLNQHEKDLSLPCVEMMKSMKTNKEQ